METWLRVRTQAAPLFLLCNEDSVRCVDSCQPPDLLVYVMVGGVGSTTILNSRKIEIIIYRGVKVPLDKHTEIKRDSPKKQSSYCYSQVVLGVLVFLEDLFFLVFP